MTTADEDLLAKFAADELDAADETAFLLRCECEPELWRMAALVLVEHRRLVASLRTIAAERTLIVKQASSPGVADVKGFQRSATFARVGSLFVVLLSGLTFGYWVGLAQRPGLNSQVVANMQSVPVREDSQSPTYIIVRSPETSTSEQDRTNSTLIKAESNHSETEPSFMERMVTCPQDARMALRKAGFEVDEEANLVVLDDGSGTRWAIPTRNYHLRYVSR